MDKVAARLMGEPVIAGAMIATAGTGGKMALGAGAAAVGGIVGSAVVAAAQTALGRDMKEPTTPGSHQGLMYVAVGPTKVAFFSVRRGLLKASIKELLVEVPRDDVAQFEVGGGALTSSLAVVLRDGTNYRLEVARAYRGKAQRVQQALAA
jgi:hypothetical protein